MEKNWKQEGEEMDGGKKRERLEESRKEEKWNVGGSHCLFKRSQEIAKN